MDEGDRARCERLARALGAWGSVPAFLDALRERGVRGASKTSVYRYLRVQTVPSIDLLTAAADVLGINRGWLLFGEGRMTETEEQLLDARRVPLASPSFEELLAEAAGIFEHAGPMTVGLFYATVQRLIAARPDWEPALAPEEVARAGRIIHEHVLEPLSRLRPRPGPVLSDREYENYLTAALHALMLAIPEQRQGRPIADLMDAAARLHLAGSPGEVKQVLEDIDRYIERETRPVAEPSGEGVEER